MDTSDRLIRAVQLAARKLASSGNFDLLMKDVLAICVEAVGATAGTLYLHDEEHHRLRFQHVLPERIRDLLPVKDIPEDFGMAGEAFLARQTIRRSLPEKPISDQNAFEQATGVPVRCMVATPLFIDDEPAIGVVQLLNKPDGEFTDNDCVVLDIVASVATMAYLNYQLSEESARSSSLLGMGKVGHDIANLAASLYVNLGFGEVAVAELRRHLTNPTHKDAALHYVEALEPIFDDLKSSVNRIVGYSRLMSDMSAGRELRPEFRLGPLATTIYDSAAFFEADCRAHRIALRYCLEESAPPTLHDPLYVFRIVQNLVGNAIKAVKETIPDDVPLATEDDDLDANGKTYGEVDVRYSFADDLHTIEVKDSGPGMSPETIRRILRGKARSQWDKASGSGWGTRIVLDLTATHMGSVGIESQPGQGSTFRVSLPHRPGN